MKALFRLRQHWIVRHTKRAMAIVSVVLATAVVSTLTIDLGPGLRGLAEQQGSRYMKRTLHIGALQVRLINGHFEIDDLVIEGLRPTDRPFFTAKRLSLAVDWSALIARRPDLLVTSVEMTDWQMLVERFKDGDNFPKFRNTNAPPSGPRRMTTTLKYLGASRGQFAYEDHEMPWSIVAPNLDLSITNFPNYHGEAKFKAGLVSIQNYVPMWVNFKGRFAIDGAKVHLDRAEIDTDGAQTVAVGGLDFDHWPEQTYQVRSRVQFSRMRELFFAKETWKLGGDGDFTGVFHLFKGGHDLAGNFTSQVAAVNQYRFPSLFGSLHWTRSFFEVTDAGSRLYGGNARFSFGIRPLGSPDRPTARFDASYTDVDLRQISDLYELAGVRFSGTARGRNLLEWPLGKFSEHRGDGQIAATAPPDAVFDAADVAGRRATRSRPRVARVGPVCTDAAGRSHSAQRRRDLPLWARRCRRDQRTVRDRAHQRRILWPHRLERRAVRVPLSRRQRRLAGKRRGAGRHPDRFRVAHRSGQFWRPRRVRRRHDGTDATASSRGHVHRRGHAGLGYQSGATDARISSSKITTSPLATA